MLKGHPCKVVDYSTSKTGKHGHAKAHIVGVDIFTGKKCEDLCPASHNMSEPIVTKKEYTVMDLSDGALSLLTAYGDPKDDLNLPSGNDELDALGKQITTMFEEGQGLSYWSRWADLEIRGRRWTLPQFVVILILIP